MYILPLRTCLLNWGQMVIIETGDYSQPGATAHSAGFLVGVCYPFFIVLFKLWDNTEYQSSNGGPKYINKTIV